MYFLIDIDSNNKRLIEFDVFGTVLKNININIDFIDKTFGLCFFLKIKKLLWLVTIADLKLGLS